MSIKAESQTTESKGMTNPEVETEIANNETIGQVVEDESLDTDESAEHDVVVTIGEEAPLTEEHTQAPEWVRELRKSHRELQRKNRELEDKLKISIAETKPAVTLDQKPKLEDHDYDANKYEQALETWYEQKHQIDEQTVKAQAEAKVMNDAWQVKLTSYNKAKTELKVKDFDDAEAIVQDIFSTTQQGIILQGTDNPALMIYALGKNPIKAKELASITDPVKYSFAIAKLETQLKVMNHKVAPRPEKTIHGTESVSGTVDSQLERLRADAEKTGDFTKVVAYKRSKRRS